MIKFLLLLLLPVTCFSQQTVKDIYKKDKSTTSQKEDSHGFYDANSKSETDILKLLELMGGAIFKFPLEKFDTRYKMDVRIDEYQNGKKINSQSIYPFDNNTYYYQFEETGNGTINRYYDYIDNLTILIKNIDKDSLATLKLQTYGGAMTTQLKKKVERSGQSYNFRKYSKTKWVLNKTIPLLVFASSWKDGELERFCGVDDLSKDEKETETLLKLSPHYFLINYIVSDK